MKHPRAKQAEGLGFPEPSALFSPEETEPVDLIGEIPEEKDDFSGIGEMEDLFPETELPEILPSHPETEAEKAGKATPGRSAVGKSLEALAEKYREGGEDKCFEEKPEEDERLRLRARERALYLLTDQMKSERRIRERLLKSGRYTPEIVEDALRFLKEYGYLDDRRMAEQLIENYRGRKSLREIEQKLYQRGIAKTVIQTVMKSYQEAEAAEEAEKEALLHLIHKKISVPSELDREQKQRLIRSLVRKGYSYSLIRELLSTEEGWSGVS